MYFNVVALPIPPNWHYGFHANDKDHKTVPHTDIYKNVIAAHDRIRDHIRRTPCEKSLVLSNDSGAGVYLKCENWQATGSFKFRGATNTVLSLDGAAKARGIITASTGNHGAAVAMAGASAGVTPTVFVPENCSPTKLNNMELLGAKIEKVKGDAYAAEQAAIEAAKTRGMDYISPYNDMRVMSGQGTIAIELLEDIDGLDAVFVAVGGGGLIAGIAGYLHNAAPNVEIVGCWPKNAPAMHACIEAGKVIDVAEEPTLSDGTAGGVEPSSITFEPCRDLITRHVLVEENEIVEAMKGLASNDRMMVEGAAGVALAAFTQVAADYKGKKVAIILCGRNIALDKYLSIVSTDE